MKTPGDVTRAGMTALVLIVAVCLNGCETSVESLPSRRLIFEDHFTNEWFSAMNWHHTTSDLDGDVFEVLQGQFVHTSAGQAFYYNSSFKSGRATYTFKAKGPWVFFWRGSTEHVGSGTALALVNKRDTVCYYECRWSGSEFAFHNNAWTGLQYVALGEHLTTTLTEISIVDADTIALIKVNGMTSGAVISREFRSNGHIEIGCNEGTDSTVFDDIVVNQ